MDKNLATKLLKFQQEVSAIKKDSENPFFHSKYFDVNKVIEAIRPILNKLGLVILQPLTHQEIGMCTLTTMIIDSETGSSIETTTFLPKFENLKAQEMGSAITYFRRYALVSILLLQGEQDDDGNIASKHQPKQKLTSEENKQYGVRKATPIDTKSGLNF